MRLIDLKAYLSEESIKRLVELVEDREDVVVSLVDRNLDLLWASPMGSRSMFGREQQDFAGQPITVFVHDEDAPDIVEAYRRASFGDAVSQDVRALNADGSYSPVRAIVWPVEAADDVAYVGITRPLV